MFRLLLALHGPLILSLVHGFRSRQSPAHHMVAIPRSSFARATHDDGCRPPAPGAPGPLPGLGGHGHRDHQDWLQTLNLPRKRAALISPFGQRGWDRVAEPGGWIR